LKAYSKKYWEKERISQNCFELISSKIQAKIKKLA